MIARIVVMRFQPEKVDTFKALFEEVKNHIRQFPGCEDVQLIQSLDDETEFRTYSLWQLEEHLENYRHSPLFKTTWSRTKPLFRSKPEAQSFKQIAYGSV